MRWWQEFFWFSNHVVQLGKVQCVNWVRFMFFCRQKLHMLFKYINEDVYLKCKESNLVFPFDTLKKTTCSKNLLQVSRHLARPCFYGSLLRTFEFAWQRLIIVSARVLNRPSKKTVFKGSRLYALATAAHWQAPEREAEWAGAAIWNLVTWCRFFPSKSRNLTHWTVKGNVTIRTTITLQVLQVTDEMLNMLISVNFCVLQRFLWKYFHVYSCVWTRLSPSELLLLRHGLKCWVATKQANHANWW